MRRRISFLSTVKEHTQPRAKPLLFFLCFVTRNHAHDEKDIPSDDSITWRRRTPRYGGQCEGPLRRTGLWCGTPA